MKRILFIATLSLTTSLAFAQMKVVSNGQVRVGNQQVGQSLITQGLSANSMTESDTSIPGFIDPPIFELAEPDSVSRLMVNGDGLYGSGGMISLGWRGHVSLEESVSGGNFTKGVMLLKGRGGVRFVCDSVTVFQYSAYGQTLNGFGKPFHINTVVKAPQYLTVSDARSKTDIEPLDEIGASLRDIVPVSYRLINSRRSEDPPTAQAGAQLMTGEQQGDTGDSHVQYGFLAQDIREVYPDLVYEDSEGNLSLDYTGFIPILVDAVQHLQATAEDLQTTVKQQAQLIAALQNPAAPQPQDVDGDAVVASLSQNRPNPFRTSTTVSCTLPETVGTAFLAVYDLNGNQKLRRNITARGNVDVVIEGNSLVAGLYLYTLVADGMEVATKRMILTD